MLEVNPTELTTFKFRTRVVDKFRVRVISCALAVVLVIGTICCPTLAGGASVEVLTTVSGHPPAKSVGGHDISISFKLRVL